ncbi:MAG: ABC transporter ATP-binding protein [Candidatus Zhuqueibacterota bacterium]
MIVYHITESEHVSRYLAEGLKRSEKRFFVFNNWKYIELILEGMIFDFQNYPESNVNDYKILVLNIDEDILEPSPIPEVRIPASIGEKGRLLLQSQSFYAETDINPSRIVGVRDAFGDTITDAYRIREKNYNPLWRFLSYVKPYWYFILIATSAGIVKFLIPLIFPQILRIVLDEVIADPALDLAAKSRRLMHLVGTVLLANLCWMAVTYARSIFTAVAGHSLIRDLRVALFNHVQRLSHQFFAKHQTGAIVSRVVNDIAQAQNFVGSALTNVWMDSILLVVLAVVLTHIHPLLTLVSLALMPIFLFSIRIVGRRIKMASREVQQRVEILSGGLQEKIAGVAIVKSFTREMQELRAFQSQADKLYSKILKSIQFAALNEILVGFVILSAPALVLFYGTREILNGHLTVGELTQFLLYLGMFYAPMQRLSDLNVVLANSVAAIERIFEYFDIHAHVVERPDAKSIDSVRGSIEFDHVQFGYEPNNPVLNDITFRIDSGESIAFVGPSGSGKSTLANLVPRFYDPTSGVIRLDGIDLRTMKLNSLRSHIGIVSQDTIFFTGTVRENLLLANPKATPQDLERALVAANALEFVESMSEGLWTEIGERGSRLSGGQRQRLAIARAFLKDPRILILDEATSALDSRSEHLIQDALNVLLKGRTSIIIAHRLSTVISANRIVVINKGSIEEMGSHQQLLDQGGLYSQLYREQFFHIAGNSEN